MKQFLWIFLMLSVFTVTSYAQDDGEKLAKKAKKSVTDYFLDPTVKTHLTEAKDQIDRAFATGAVDANATAWATRGEIYSQLGQQDAALKAISADAKAMYPDASDIAFSSYMKSYELSSKESAKKEALQGLNDIISILSNSGLDAFYERNYARAYKDFNNILVINKLLGDAKMKAPLSKPEDLSNQYYITGLAALNNEQNEVAGSLFLKSLETGNNKAEVYDGLFRAYNTSDPAKAEQYLLEGRKLHPDDNNLLFSEINLYLAQGKMESLLDKLQLAIQKEPDNVSVINTLGNVYDKLYQTTSEKGDTINANIYFNKALENYQMALTKDPKNSFANYSIGTLYYNRAAYWVRQMQSVADDMTKAGMKKFEVFEKQMMAMFDLALPYFQKAEESDPTDRNTLIALKEIYARQNNLDKANEYKVKLKQME